MRKLVVAVSGPPGSGKSTFSRIIAEELGLRYFSAGMLFRSIAEERGVSVKALHRVAEDDHEIDRMVDRRSVEEAKKGGVVIDAHLAGWILKDLADIKIYLDAPAEVRARRVARRDGVDFETAFRNMVERERSNAKRYMEIYGIDVSDLSVFDLVINTAKWDKGFIAIMLINAIKNMKRSGDK